MCNRTQQSGLQLRAYELLTNCLQSAFKQILKLSVKSKSEVSWRLE